MSKGPHHAEVERLGKVDPFAAARYAQHRRADLMAEADQAEATSDQELVRAAGSYTAAHAKLVSRGDWRGARFCERWKEQLEQERAAQSARGEPK